MRHKPHLQWRLTIILFMIALSILVIGTIIFAVYERRNMRLLYNAFYETLNAFSSAVERELSAAERLSLEILGDEQVQNLMRRMADSPFPFQWQQDSEQLSRRFQLYTRLPYVEAIIGIDTTGRISNSRTDFPAFSRFAGDEVFHWIDTGGASRNWFAGATAEDRLLFVRRIREIRGLSFRPLGDLVLVIDKNRLARATAGTPFDDDLDQAVILDGQVIFRDGTVIEEILQRFEGRYPRFDRVDHQGSAYFLASVQHPPRGLTFVYAIPYDLLFSGVQRFNTLLVALLIVLLVIGLWVSWWTARYISSPIVQLAHRMRSLEEADFRALPEEIRTYSRQDEIGTLYREFGIMLKRIDTLISEGYQTQIALKDTQFRSLQAQINPHFLYNTLESINWIAQLEGHGAISRMVQSLGTLLRASIETDRTALAIDEELDLLEKYVIIQRQRFGDRLVVHVDVTEQCRTYGIPKLTLQPLAENAIKYGLERYSRPCLITVRGTIEQNLIVLRVSDNGPGMTAEFATSILAGEVEPRGTGVGIKNIQERLVRLFGEKARLMIESEPDRGTTIVIVIPPVAVDDLARQIRGSHGT